MVESFEEKETFFFMRRMEGEVDETEGGAFRGSGGEVSASVGECGREDVELVDC
jgi:hypothetical protein